MPLYVRIYTDAISDDKLLSISSDAVVLWLRGLLYAKQHLTDGQVRPGAMTLIGAGLRAPAEARAELVRVGLWVDDGTYLGVPKEKWSRYQTTRDQVEEDREANKERQRRFRGKNKTKTKRRASEHQSISDNGVTNASVTPLHPPTGTQECGSEVQIPLLLDTPSFRDAWKKWEKHRKEIRKPLMPTQTESQLKKCLEMGVVRAVQMIEHTIEKGWQGFREPEFNGRPAPAPKRTSPIGTVETW